MTKHAVENKGASPMYVAGRMVLPGETVLIDEADVPPEMRAPAAAPAPEAPPADALEVLRAAPVKELVPVLAGLGDEDLARLEALEEASGKPRKSLLEALAAERLARESRKLGA